MKLMIRPYNGYQTNAPITGYEVLCEETNQVFYISNEDMKETGFVERNGRVFKVPRKSNARDIITLRKHRGH